MSDADTLAAELGELRASAGIPAAAAVRVSSSGMQSVAVDGVRRIGHDDVVEIGDRFHIGSNAKSMTALLAALAVEQGALGWDTGVGDILAGVPRSPTLRQLLTHSAGLPGYGEDEEIAAVVVPEGSPAQQRAAFAPIALGQPPLFEPGTAHAYSNAGYAIAAAMVEAVTGEAWEDALATRIFVPLEMDGRVGWPALHATDAPLGHWPVDGVLQPHDPATDDYALPPWARPAGDVSVSIGDYGRWLVEHLAGLRGDGRLGPRSMYRALHTPDPPDDEGGVGYALGWGVRETADGPMSMHTGSADTFYAVVVLVPERDRGIGVFTNSYTDQHELAVNTLVKDLIRR
jgi:CubicO group peptidase (beta-lactamase class C family)